MSKRKIDEVEDATPVGERHEKLRIQEVDPLPNARMSTTGTAAETSKDHPDRGTIEKRARQLKKRERRALRKLTHASDHRPDGRLEGDLDSFLPATKNSEPDNKTAEGDISALSGTLQSADDAFHQLSSKALQADDHQVLDKESKWKASGTVGGQMLDLDPIFSDDEQHLLIAYGTFVGVYSISSSLLVRKLQVAEGNIVSGFALDIKERSHVHVSTQAGDLRCFNWMEGQQLNRRQGFQEIHALAVAVKDADPVDDDTLYTVNRSPSGEWLIEAHRHIIKADKIGSVATTILFRYGHRVRNLHVVQGGRVIIAASERTLIIGTSRRSASESFHGKQYVWRLVDCPEWITSLDVRLRPSGRTSHKRHHDTILKAIDVVVGTLRGVIHVYDDILHKLLQKEKGVKTGKDDEILSRRLHWHRTAVLSAKWSSDGNYIISGGQETVLVLWQLETDLKQVLPHLGAAVESIVVSPTGSTYSVRLADNSAMILSTAELQPTFSIAGAQLPSQYRDTSALPFIPTVDTHEVTRGGMRHRSRFPACVSNSGIDKLLLAVPPSVSQHAANVVHNASYLQTCDLRSGHQLARQALTRTNITTLNLGPEGNTLEEPNVTLMDISHDGQWLATVDEWSPPTRDLEFLAFDGDKLGQDQISRVEMHLKFWSWNEADQVWELVSRIDNPYMSDVTDIYRSSKILDLTSDPNGSAFSTVGEDGTVKMWRPAARRRHELIVKGQDGVELTSWHCYNTISLIKDTGPHIYESAKLAYSSDGSILAVALPAASFAAIDIINAHSGALRTTYTGISEGPIYGLGIVDKYLILLSHELVVWDLVNEETHFGLDLQIQALSPEKAARSLLAVDHRHGTFALAFKDPESSKSRTKLAIFEPANPQPLFVTTISSIITTLLPAINKKTYYVIDDNAEIRTIVPTQGLRTGLPTPPLEELPARRGLDAILGRSGKKALEARSADADDGERQRTLTAGPDALFTDERKDVESNEVVVSHERLSEVYGNGPTMPPIDDMFHKVAMLYGGIANL